ncbi:hypothetical protein PSTEL_22665 [Paenibacillus stellifer]|uniref:Uncharacterized protein n=1 Tax=Paenibacillus stellifer TaxID=169760 RepID=A0A089LZE4_9BACL|nr:hypothetical protein PSTEL_22665 [Paenibacillus stellifer]
MPFGKFAFVTNGWDGTCNLYQDGTTAAGSIYVNAAAEGEGGGSAIGTYASTRMKAGTAKVLQRFMIYYRNENCHFLAKNKERFYITRRTVPKAGR